MERIQKCIGEILGSRPVITIPPQASVRDALGAMVEAHADCALVVEREEVAGIFTERDLVTRVLGAGLDPAATPVARVMTRDPEVLGAEDRLSYAINQMVVGGYRNLPILADGGGAGVLSARDVVAHLDEVIGALAARDDGAIPSEWLDLGGGD